MLVQNVATVWNCHETGDRKESRYVSGAIVQVQPVPYIALHSIVTFEHRIQTT